MHGGLNLTRRAPVTIRMTAPHPFGMVTPPDRSRVVAPWVNPDSYPPHLAFDPGMSMIAR